jgi:hypothetical protein
MQPHCIDGEVVPEQQVVPHSEPLVELLLTFNMGLDKLRYIESAFLLCRNDLTRLGNASDSFGPELLCQGLRGFQHGAQVVPSALGSEIPIPMPSGHTHRN